MVRVMHSGVCREDRQCGFGWWISEYQFALQVRKKHLRQLKPTPAGCTATAAESVSFPLTSSCLLLKPNNNHPEEFTGAAALTQGFKNDQQH